jgi:hypothetical protein
MIGFLKIIADLYSLYKAIKKYLDEVEAERKVKDDVQKITEAFNAKDASKLNDIFNNRLPDKKEKT